MARLIRTEKEVEGRYEDVWIVVDEDALEQWPDGPLTTVGREVPRVDGLDRARGQVQFTADLQLPGMLHTAVLRSPYARARVTSIDLGAARAARGVRAVLGPDELDVLKEELDQIRELLLAAQAMWRALPEEGDDADRVAHVRATFRLIHLADIVAVTTPA